MELERKEPFKVRFDVKLKIDGMSENDVKVLEDSLTDIQPGHAKFLLTEELDTVAPLDQLIWLMNNYPTHGDKTFDIIVNYLDKSKERILMSNHMTGCKVDSVDVYDLLNNSRRSIVFGIDLSAEVYADVNFVVGKGQVHYKDEKLDHTESIVEEDELIFEEEIYDDFDGYCDDEDCGCRDDDEETGFSV